MDERKTLIRQEVGERGSRLWKITCHCTREYWQHTHQDALSWAQWCHDEYHGKDCRG